MRRRCLLLALVLLPLAAPTGAQQPASPTPATPAPPTPAPATPAPPTGHAALDGVVRDSVGRPLANAVITAEALERSVLTNDEGRFRLEGLPADTVDFAVRRVGYAPAYFAVQLIDSATVSIAVKMLPALVELGKVIIEGERRDVALVRTGFYERRRAGRGVFFDGNRLEGYGVNPFVSALRNTPRVRVECNRGRCVPLMHYAGTSCVPILYLDGMKVFAQATDYDMLLATADLKGVEVYRSAAEVPNEFAQPFGRCGVIVAWTAWNGGR